SPASIRAARIWRPEAMLLIARLHVRSWKRRHRPPCFILSDGHMLVRRPAIPAAPMPLPRWCDFAERDVWNVGALPASVRLDAGDFDHLAPFVGVVSDKPAKVGGRHRHWCAAQVEQRGLLFLDRRERRCFPCSAF